MGTSVLASLSSDTPFNEIARPVLCQLADEEHSHAFELIREAVSVGGATNTDRALDYFAAEYQDRCPSAVSTLLGQRQRVLALGELRRREDLAGVRGVFSGVLSELPAHEHARAKELIHDALMASGTTRGLERALDAFLDEFEAKWPAAAEAFTLGMRPWVLLLTHSPETLGFF